MRRHAILLLLALGLPDCRRRGTNVPVEKTKTTHPEIDIKPGRSIGKVSLGASAADLPQGAPASGPVGEVEGVHFLLENGHVEDVWIEDLRTIPLPVRFAGRAIARDTPLAELKSMFGACEQVTTKGGVFFNCSAGVTIGTDGGQQGTFIQLRLKPR
jgi:hypothetical protein